MIKNDHITREKRNNPNWSQIPDHPCMILITDGSEPGKTN